jgi:tetratricopeptide (TPR) repeat protein
MTPTALAIRVAFAAFLSWLFSALSLGGELAFQPQPGLEAALFQDAKDGKLDRFTLLEASLIAEGIHDAERIDRYRRQVNQWTRELRRRGAARGDINARAEKILTHLHDRVFTRGYDAQCSRVSRVIDDGRFNCVSATILFNQLAGQLGISTSAVAKPGHVWSRLETSPTLDVQTTCPNWFAVLAGGSRPDSADPRGREQLVDDGSHRALTPLNLVAKIYYNRSVAELRRNRFAQAVVASQAGLLLDPHDAAARNNLLAALNNWALRLCENGDYSRAAAVATYGLSIAPDYQPLTINDLHIHQKWVLSLCDQGRFDEALQVLRQAHQRRPDADLFDRGRHIVRQMRTRSRQTPGA